MVSLLTLLLCDLWEMNIFRRFPSLARSELMLRRSRMAFWSMVDFIVYPKAADRMRWGTETQQFLALQTRICFSWGVNRTIDIWVRFRIWLLFLTILLSFTLLLLIFESLTSHSHFTTGVKGWGKWKLLKKIYLLKSYLPFSFWGAIMLSPCENRYSSWFIEPTPPTN